MEKKYNFYCVNCDCSNKDKHHNQKTFVIPMTEEEKEENDIACPNNSEVVLKCQGYSPTWGLNKFDSLTPDQKQQVLLKRSRDHYKKNIAEERHEKNKALIKNFKDQ